MGEPEHPEQFARFQVDDDITVYVERGLLDKLDPEERRQPFYLDGYGRFWVRLPPTQDV